MKDVNCGYCGNEEALAQFAFKICDLSVSSLYLFKEQSHKGRCIVAYKDHISEIVDITKEERDAFFDDITKASNAIHSVFNPKKVNYGAYGDTGCHLHFHLVPKYENGFEYGGTFEMNPKKTFLSDEEYKELIEAIKNAL